MPEYKYAKVINEETKLCEVGIGTNETFYKSLGFTKQEVEQSYTGEWYLKGYAPSKPEPTTAEKVQVLEQATGLTRAVRELVLADGSGASDYVRAKAQEIEALANPLRGGPEVSAPAETQTEEGL
nr:MAG TPA: hypothetical protein [Caudoviricetes sp.]